MNWKFKRFSTLALAFTAFALATACRGFFQNPTISSVSVSPSTDNLQIGGTVALSAIAMNNDGTTKDVSGLAMWQSSDTASVTVSSTGVAKALQNTTSAVTVTATYKGFSGSSSITVGGQSVTVTCNNCSGNSISITGSGGIIDLSSNVAANWSSSNSSVISVSGSNTTTPTASFGGTTGSATITAAAASGNGSGNATITVTP